MTNLRTISPYKKKIYFTRDFHGTSRLLMKKGVSTICQNGRCPNISECFSQKKLTFLILGDRCTRNCAFCHVDKDTPRPVDEKEIEKVLEVVEQLGLRYVVITSVTRDDLDDGGAGHYDLMVRTIKERFPKVKVELLVPDFKGQEDPIKKIALSHAEIIGHNMETVRRLYPSVRSLSDYDQSLGLLEQMKRINPDRIIKSGFMVGLGESREEIEELLKDLFNHRVDAVTMGQYFQPSLRNIPVSRFYSDEEFSLLEEKARSTGFLHVSSGRFVRSSYYAEELFPGS